MARVDITISRAGLELRIGGDIPDATAAQITRDLTKLVSERAAADPLVTGQAPQPQPRAAAADQEPASDTQVPRTSKAGQE